MRSMTSTLGSSLQLAVQAFMTPQHRLLADRSPLLGRHPRPPCDLIDRATTADAYAVRVKRADVDAGGLYGFGGYGIRRHECTGEI